MQGELNHKKLFKREIKMYLRFFSFVFVGFSFLYATVPDKENIAKLYVATFNRAPDVSGLDYWVHSGMQVENIAKSFFEQPETKKLYPLSTSNSDFIRAVYYNLFNRTPDNAGAAYWQEALDSGSVEKSSFILTVINGALDKDAVILENKTTVGIDFAENGYHSISFAKSIISGITSDTITVEKAFKAIQDHKISTLLSGVKVDSWMYQIQGLDEKNAIDKLGETSYDMLVVEPGHNLKDEPYDTTYLVSKLQKKTDGRKRLLVAYVDIGQAEDYRSYWRDDWVAPTETQAGIPNFMITIDPDGWSGNYPVAYWNIEWQDIWLSENGIIRQIANYGFDGVYLDWVEAYDEPRVQEAAEAQKINPQQAMLDFIAKIRAIGKQINPNFVVIVQNAPYLLDIDPVYYSSIIDAIATEDTWFYGQADVSWDDPEGGDMSGGERQAGEYSTQNRIIQNTKYLHMGLPVFTVDYALHEDHAQSIYENSHNNEFIPLVTRISLSHITETPPPTIED